MLFDLVFVGPKKQRDSGACACDWSKHVSHVSLWICNSYWKQMCAGENWISNSIRLTQVLVYREGSMAKKPGPRPSKLSVYLYIPNIIGGLLSLLVHIVFLCFLFTCYWNCIFLISYYYHIWSSENLSPQGWKGDVWV